MIYTNLHCCHRSRLCINTIARSDNIQYTFLKNVAQFSVGTIFSALCQLDDALNAYNRASALITQLDKDPKSLHAIDQEVRSLRRMCVLVWRTLFP